MPTLTSLPPELLGQIIRNIVKSGWLLDLTLSCRYLHDFTLPYLYSAVKLLPAVDEPKILHKCLRSFVLRMLDKPTIASHVRDFTMTGSWTERYSYRTARQQSNDLKTLEWLFPKSIDSPGKIVSMAKDLLLDDDLSGDILLAVLLFTLTNLQRLELMIPERDVSCYRKMIKIISERRKPYNIPPALNSLRVMVHHFNEDYPVARDELGPDTLSIYLGLPNLQKFYGQVARSFSWDGNYSSAKNDRLYRNKDLAKLEPASLQLTHFEVRNSKLNSQDLMNTLRAFKNLRTFVYGSEGIFDQHEFFKALAWTEHSLQQLWLDHEGRGTITGESCFSSLATFKNLKNVKVGMFVLFGSTVFGESGHTAANVDLANVLPPSLETIYFSHTDFRIRVLTAALEKWLIRKSSKTPKLRRIAFDISETVDQETADFSLLDWLAAQTGVTIDKLKLPSSIGQYCGTQLICAESPPYNHPKSIGLWGRGADDSLIWVTEQALHPGYGVPVFINAGQD